LASTKVETKTMLHSSLRPSRSSFALAVVLAGVMASRVVYAGGADAAGNDQLTLKSGRTLRGTVVSSEPGHPVKILVAGEKKARLFRWPQVRRVEKGKFDPKPPAVEPDQPPAPEPAPPLAPGPGAPAPAAATPAQPPSEPGVVHLHVESPEPVEIYRHLDVSAGRAAELSAPTMVCGSPCDVSLDGRKGQEFSVAGIDVNESARFKVTGMTGEQDLAVSPGPSGLHTAGVASTVGGGAVAVGGAGLAILAALQNRTDTETTANGVVLHVTQNYSQLETAGLVVLGVGVAAAVVGVVAMAASGTGIHFRRSDSSPEPPTAAARKPRYWAGEF
jgi:hypothetical protein